MATPLVSPGVLVREVDLTVGRPDNGASVIGAIAGPFSKGPVNEVTQIGSEKEMIEVFGKPSSTDAQYEYWMSAASFLSYGGRLAVVRTSNDILVNANAGISTDNVEEGPVDDLQIFNLDSFNEVEDSVRWAFAAKNPGSWANGLKVCIIDSKADQIIGINTTNLEDAGIVVGYAVTVSLGSTTYATSSGIATFTGYLNGIVTGTYDDEEGNSTIEVKIISKTDDNGVTTPVTYSQNERMSSFSVDDELEFYDGDGNNTGTEIAESEKDWYDEQTIELPTGTFFWKNLAPKPGTTAFSAERGGRHDEIHVLVYDTNGSVSGIAGNLLEKHIGLSKGNDVISSQDSPLRLYWRDYLAQFSRYIYSGANISAQEDVIHSATPVATGFSNGWNPLTVSEGLWNVPSFSIEENRGVTFSGLGNISYDLTAGSNYDAENGYSVTLGDLLRSYDLFSNKTSTQVDFLLMGPGLANEQETQAKANNLISIAELRRDCIACISCHRDNVVNVPNSEDQTNNVLKFFGPLQSSSFAVFDSGYKYTYDKFNNKFRYIPCNSDTAGVMARTGINNYPWFSPAGQQRGVFNNAVKLAYNPSQSQRDRLYTKRINPVISLPGTGILLFGDKTGLAYASAFDRINVRRLFLTVEKALESAANAQLFELNDELTRANFVNVIDPYLRDIKAKRGVYDYLVICDDTNNTPDIIDNNEFRADIYLKPTKSINFVTLTFVATRTGVSFSEVAGRV